MKPGPIQRPSVQHPYYSAEYLAGEWNYSLATLLRKHRKWSFRTTTTGNGRGQVWYHRGDVWRRLGPPPAKRFSFCFPRVRAERCAGALNMSLAAFKSWARRLNCLVVRKGKGRGFVWYNWDNVRREFSKAGFANIERWI